MKVLGFDPGSRILGFGVLESTGRGWRRVDSGVLRLNTRQTQAKRLLCISEEATALIARHHPDYIAIEEAFVSHSPRTALVLGQVRGVLLLESERSGAAVREFAPRSIKLATVGNGGAAKKQVQFMIPRLILDCPELPPPDEADALAVAWCCANQLRGSGIGSGSGSTPGWEPGSGSA